MNLLPRLIFHFTADEMNGQELGLYRIFKERLTHHALFKIKKKKKLTSSYKSFYDESITYICSKEDRKLEISFYTDKNGRKNIYIK